MCEISDERFHARVALRLQWYNTNAVGTQFGGSLFAMPDPFWMLFAMRARGYGCNIWDQRAVGVFVLPGRGRVTAELHVDPCTLAAIRTATTGGEKYLQRFGTDVRADDGSVVARVRKQVHVRRKPQHTPS